MNSKLKKKVFENLSELSYLKKERGSVNEGTNMDMFKPTSLNFMQDS